MSISRSVGGGEVETIRHAIKAGETLTDGDFVTLEADGTVAEAGAASAAIYGRARIDFNDTDGYALVEPANRNTQFLVRADDDITVADVGHRHALSVAASGEHQLDVDAVDTTDIFTIREIQDAAARKVWVSVTTGLSQADDSEV